jgi:hypothetical protein
MKKICAVIIKFQTMSGRKVRAIVGIYQEAKPSTYSKKIINNEI